MFKGRRFRIPVLLVVLALLVIGGIAAADSPLAGPQLTILHQFDGEQVGDGFGWVGADLGDITGDGLHDFLIPAPFFAADDGTFPGKFYVYSGADGALLHAETGTGTAYLGYSAAAAGDVDGDGVGDYIVGAPLGSYANVYSGADHALLMTFSGVGGDVFGSAVTGAGDVNGDGHADLLVGAYRASGTAANAGRAYLFSGADGTLLWTHDGQASSQFLGSAAGLVGDVNGDDIPDQIVGAFGAAEAYILSGQNGDTLFTLTPERPEDAAYFGLYFASGADDYNADGIPDAFVADYAATVDGVPGTGNAFVFSGADGSILEAIDGREPGGGFGPGRAFADIDGDGFGDMVFGYYTSSAHQPGAGLVEVWTGRGNRHAHQIQKIFGTVENDNFGVDALPVGDLNGDGLMDFMGTAVGNNFAGADVGHVFVVAGVQHPK